MKKEWCLPKAVVEEFATNEYLNTCWGVACNTDKANDWEEKNNNTQYEDLGVRHQLEHCGRQTNQVLKDINSDGTFDKMIEIGTDGLGNLNCTLYTDDSYEHKKKNFKKIYIGTPLYWTTKANDGRIWHHQGTVIGMDSTCPNRS